MKKILLATGVIATLIYVASNMEGEGGASPGERPPQLQAAADAPRLTSIEFLDLLDAGTPTSTLAVPGYYTVVEGYLNSCGICKVLEKKFPAFLDSRHDVVIRKVHFPERGVNASFRSEAEARDYYRRLGLYRFNDIEVTGDSVRLAVCGTPHIEIYDPDGNLMVGDLCETKSKAGLDYLNGWISAEI